jgi:hypothetical protein
LAVAVPLVLKLGWTISTPARSPLAVVFCLHGYHNDHQMAFDQLHVPQVAAELDAGVHPAGARQGATAPGAFDSPADFYANDVFTGVDQLRAMKVAVFCGEQDPFYLATRQLVSLMHYPHEARLRPAAMMMPTGAVSYLPNCVRSVRPGESPGNRQRAEPKTGSREAR